MASVDSCPGCGAARGAKVSAPAPGFDVQAGGRVFSQPAYSMVECAVCGIFYKSDVWAANDERAYYRALDPLKWEWDGLFPTERIALDMVRAAARPGARVLDFGCSTGRLLDALGDGYGRYGVEVNEAAAAIANSKGIRLLGADELAARAGGFEAIVLCDVIEHMREPMTLLRDLHGCLGPGGMLIVVTGNVDAPACRRDVAGFWYVRNIEHLTMLGRRFFEYAAADLRCGIEEWRTACHYDMPVAKRLMQHARDISFRAFRYGGLPARALRWVPVVNRARRWTMPPALECTRDHVVVGLRKQGNRI